MANPDNVLSTMLQSLFITGSIWGQDRAAGYKQFPFPYFSDIETPIFSLVGGQYIALGSWTNLTDGQFNHLRLTDEGRLMVDTTVNVVVNTSPTRWTRKFFVEVAVTNVDQTVTFVDPVLGAFSADEVVISNDDLVNSIWFDYGLAAVADVNHDKLNASEVMTDEYQALNIHLISDVAGPSTVRIWARAEV